MSYELKDDDILKEFMELSFKCGSLPDIANVKPERKLRNRYSDIQPCKK